MPDGALPGQFHLQDRPQTEFTTSAPSNKCQADKKSAMRRKGDKG